MRNFLNFLLEIIFAVIGTLVAWVLGQWLMDYMDVEMAMLCAIVTGRCMLLITDALKELILDEVDF